MESEPYGSSRDAQVIGDDPTAASGTNPAMNAALAFSVSLTSIASTNLHPIRAGQIIAYQFVIHKVLRYHPTPSAGLQEAMHRFCFANPLLCSSEYSIHRLAPPEEQPPALANVTINSLVRTYVLSRQRYCSSCPIYQIL